MVVGPADWARPANGYCPARRPPGPSCSRTDRRIANHRIEGVTMDLGLDVTERNDYWVLAVSGEVDVATVPRLREQLHGLVAQCSTKIIVNLDSVDFLDSTGLGVLVG